MVIKKRVISGWVTTKGSPCRILLIKNGTTDPAVPSTFPKRTVVNTFDFDPWTYWAAQTSRSARSLLAPIVLDGCTALSVEIIIKRDTLGVFSAAVIRF